MEHQLLKQPDYGTGQKKLSTYIVGLIICSLLTILSFWVVMTLPFERTTIFIIIFASACIQFIVQVICFLRLNTQTEQGRFNVMALVFTAIILLCVVFGSLWIMWTLNYRMML